MTVGDCRLYLRREQRRDSQCARFCVVIVERKSVRIWVWVTAIVSE